MTVVFSTYQSIDVISEAQKELNKKYSNEYNFDLIICDEAHRTTGVVLNKTTEKEQSCFTKVHNNNFIVADKRIYMTATPRLYTTDAKEKAINNENIDILCSMDDENIYGKEIYKIGFGEAVDKKLLSPYKVFVLSIKKEDVITSDIIKKIKEQNKAAKEEKNGEEIEEDDVAKLIGCINTLSKKMTDSGEYFKLLDPEPMKKAVAFCKKISISKGVTKFFNDLVDEGYYDKLFSKEEKTVIVKAEHIDGGMRASKREGKLLWLKKEEKNICKVLTNVRCLSEGVDVPSLDAVMFLSTKNSEVDVVQAVGRVMRRAENKQFGYIIIPVVIPYGVDPKKYMDKSDKFKVVWDVLNALKAHDDTFEAHINSLSINGNNENNGSDIIIIYDGSGKKRNDEDKIDIIDIKKQMELFGDLRNKFYAKLTEKFGSKKYYKIWAKDVAEIAKANINRINNILANNTKAKNEFNRFVNKLHKEINPSIVENDAIEMLSQHLITQPVFEALFESYSFAKNNPVSKSMSKVIQLLEEQTTQEENEKLQRFYDGIKRRIKNIKTAEDKQSIIKELYENFFAVAFKNVVEKLGIVYTPIEVVDFIIHSVNDILKKEFGKSLTDKGVEIIDPFTGTGTFITRLLQSGLIRKEDLARKYRKEIFANEIVLLAYYIASINIENVYHSLLDENENYKSFEGVCLTDTFQLYEDAVIEEENKNMLFETDTEGEKMILENSERIKRQKKSPIKIIISNPPYSVGQKSANDNNQNQHYEKLEEKIKNTYVKYSKAQKSSMYDSYIKAFRWASDRIDANAGGIIGFITNSGWIDSGGADGFRYCLKKDFSNIYIFDLKGAIRGKSGEAVKKEGQNIFNIMTGVAITILVKNPNNINNKAKIHYYDAGDYLKRKEKLEILKNYKSILNDNVKWQEIIPNKHNDWLNQRNELFNSYIPIESDKKYNFNTKSYFVNYSAGISTARDIWVYNFSKNELKKNINTTINFYNEQRINVNNIIKKGENNIKRRKNLQSISKILRVKKDKLSKIIVFIEIYKNKEQITEILKSDDIKNTYKELSPLFIDLNNKFREVAVNYIINNKETINGFIKNINNISQGFKKFLTDIFLNINIKNVAKNLQNVTNSFQNVSIVLNRYGYLKKIVIKDFRKCNWTRDWDKYLIRNEEIKEDKNSYYEGIYRPFCKENVYFNEYLNEERLQMPSIFPYKDAKNLCICVSGSSSGKGFNCLITDSIANYDLLSKTQCFPFHYYTKKEQGSLFGEEDDYTKHDGISDFILKRCQENYKTKDITKEDIFYYVYGFLHNENYRNKFQVDLKRMLPRIPLVDKLEDFNKISNIGRQLAELHLNYETVPANKDCVVIGKESNDFCVKKMSFGKNGKDKDKSVIIYSSSIRIENIPQKAYEYVVNGKSAIEWVMDRYQVTQDKNSGLTNDPNDWGKEHGKPSYVLDLLLSVMEVSVRTVDLVKEVNKINVKFD